MSLAVWLSLERCIERALKKFLSLKSCFLGEGFSDERFKRLKDAFSNPLLEPVLLFHTLLTAISNAHIFWESFH